MIKVTNPIQGFALFIACEYASNLEYRKKNGGDVEELKSKSTRELIKWLIPQGVIEEMLDATDPLILELIDFYMDPQAPWDFYREMWAKINEIENKVEQLINLVDENKLWCLVATNMEVWYMRGVGEDDPGVLVDQSFFITLIELAQKTEQIVVWDHGPFQAIAGFEGELSLG